MTPKTILLIAETLALYQDSPLNYKRRGATQS